MRRAVVLLGLLVLGAWASPAQAATPLHPGSLDLSFGTRGVVESTRSGGASDDVATDAAGRVLIASAEAPVLVVRRLDPDGHPDRRFGVGGVARITRPDFDGNAQVLSLRVGAGGRVLLAGLGRSNLLVVAALTARGDLDPAFADRGLWTGDLKALSYVGRPVEALLPRPDGGLEVAAAAIGDYGYGDQSNTATSVYALDRRGVPVPTFGLGGAARFDVGRLLAAPSLYATEDGAYRLVLTSGYDSTLKTPFLARTRLNADGSARDASGIVVDGPTAAPALQGRRLLVPDSRSLLALTQYGAIDEAFAQRGRWVPPRDESVAAVAVDGGGRSLVATTTVSSPTSDGPAIDRTRLRRLRPDGRLDPAFRGATIALPPGRVPDGQRVRLDRQGRALLLTSTALNLDRDDYRLTGTTLLRFRTTAPLARLAAASYAVGRSGLVRLRVRCAGPASCRGTVHLGGRTASFRAAGRRATTVRLRLAPTRRAAVTRATSVLRLRSGGRTDTVGEAIRLVRR